MVSNKIPTFNYLKQTTDLNKNHIIQTSVGLFYMLWRIASFIKFLLYNLLCYNKFASDNKKINFIYTQIRLIYLFDWHIIKYSLILLSMTLIKIVVATTFLAQKIIKNILSLPIFYLELLYLANIEIKTSSII